MTLWNLYWSCGLLCTLKLENCSGSFWNIKGFQRNEFDIKCWKLFRDFLFLLYRLGNCFRNSVFEKLSDTRSLVNIPVFVTAAVASPSICFLNWWDAKIFFLNYPFFILECARMRLDSFKEENKSYLHHLLFNLRLVITC